jgi:hypothetical protein
LSYAADYLNDFKETNAIATHDEVVAKVPLVKHSVEEWFAQAGCSEVCDHFIRAVVGHRKFDQDKRTYLVSTFVTISDEAFCLLVCENNLEKWLDMYKREDRKQSNVVPKYTNGGRSNNANGSSRRNKGWSQTGTRRYVQLYEFVTNQRKTVNRKLAEKSYLMEKTNEYESRRPNRGKQLNGEEIEVEIPHSLWDDCVGIVHEEINGIDRAPSGSITNEDEEDDESLGENDETSDQISAKIAALRSRGKVFQA